MVGLRTLISGTTGVWRDYDTASRALLFLRRLVRYGQLPEVLHSMSTLDLSPDEVLMVVDLGYGPEATTLYRTSVSLCGPCLEHDGRHRRAVWTGQREMDFLAPNLCPTHKQARDAGREWDRALGSVGRPRLSTECVIEGCEEVPRALSLCTRHYSKARRNARRAANTDTTGR